MKDILVHLNHVDTLNDRLRLTDKLVEKFDSYVTGLYVKRKIELEIYSSFTHPDIFNEFEEKQSAQADKAKTLFEQNVATTKLNRTFTEVTGDSSQELIFNGGAHDLIVVARYDVDKHFENMAHVPTNVALGSGRPVMIVPDFSEQAKVGKSVLVAWNGTKESTRAIHDAMPFLQSADYVNLVSLTPENESADVVDIESHLEHHGVTFDMLHSHAMENEISNQLAHFAKKFDSDMLVMGAYGHSRLSEYILGGVSKSVFRSTNIPVLVSH